MNPTAHLAETNNDCPWTDRSISVERVATANLPTSTGNFKIAGYRSLNSDEEFVVLYTGEMDPEVPTLVRIHSQCLTGDVFGSIKCDCGPQLHKAMNYLYILPDHNRTFMGEQIRDVITHVYDYLQVCKVAKVEPSLEEVG